MDAGLSARETARRLEQCGSRIEDLAAVCISHEHSDHVAGLRVLHQKYGIPCYANRGTSEALVGSTKIGAIRWTMFTTGSPFTIGDLTVEPFSVPHDAYEPVGYRVSCNGTSVAVVTDMGIATGLIRSRLSGCKAVVVEANHDDLLLRNAERPWYLKQRIAGRQGHLSNQAAAELIEEIAGPHLEHVYLAHLSEDCNDGPLAEKLIRDVLGRKSCAATRVSLTYPDRISDIWPA